MSSQPPDELAVVVIRTEVLPSFEAFQEDVGFRSRFAASPDVVIEPGPAVSEPDRGDRCVSVREIGRVP